MTSRIMHNPHSAGAKKLGQTKAEEHDIIQTIRGFRWYLLGWVVMNILSAYFSGASSGDIESAIVGAIFTGIIMGVPAALLVFRQGFFSACVLLAYAILNAVGVIFMAMNGMIRFNIFAFITAIVIVAGMYYAVRATHMLRRLRRNHTHSRVA